MVMKNYSSDARQIVCERDSIHDFSKEEGNIIKDNDMTLDVVGYFNVDELEWWIWVLMGLVLPCVGYKAITFNG